MEDKKNKIYISTLVIFWIIFAFFILNVSSMYLPFIPFIGFIGLPFNAVISLLGIALIILVARAKITKISRAFFILTGSSTIGIGFGAYLHNLVFALFIKLFGEGFWERTGIGDEPVFFILATIVCPIALLVGVISSIVFIAKKKVIA